MDHPVKHRDLERLAEYQEELMRQPRLKYIFFELTDRCNLRCLHCGSNCSPGNGTFLPYDAVERTLRSIGNEYAPREVMVCLTGGEPLLHPELERIIHTAHGMGFPVGITTNGTLIDDCRAERLARCGLDTAAVSIDGTREVHDRFRCCPGSFDQAVQGARALMKHGIWPQAVTVANKSNLRDLPQLCRVLTEEGFESWRITNMDPIGRAEPNSHLLLSQEELVGLLQFIRQKRLDPDLQMEVTYGCSHFLTYEFEREVRDFYFQCGAGTLVASVMASGDIGACLDIERRRDLVQGNIERDDFITVWKERFEVFRVNRAEQSSVCSSCEYSSVCRGDSAHTWDYDLQKPRYCLFKGGQCI